MGAAAPSAAAGAAGESCAATGAAAPSAGSSWSDETWCASGIGASSADKASAAAVDAAPSWAGSGSASCVADSRACRALYSARRSCRVFRRLGGGAA
eukprot:7169776-Prymnesium_polylepis.5